MKNMNAEKWEIIKARTVLRITDGDRCIMEITTTPHRHEELSREEFKARAERDAGWIATAPEMLEALETLLNLYDGETDGGEGITPADWEKVREIITKATA